MYLLDTNHLSGLLENDLNVVARCQLLWADAVSTCAVVRGELIYMAEKSDRRDENLTRIRGLLDDLRIYPVDDITADTYGALKAKLIQTLGPKEPRKRRQFEFDDLGISDNDLWIAAVAQQWNLVVVSIDSDFQRIHQATGLPVENWLSPPAGQPTDEP